jgi:glucosamine kinase
VVNAEYRLGIDGGGTGCRARLTDMHGRVLGEGQAGAANLGLGVDVALGSILQATLKAFRQVGIPERALAATDAGMGLAAANVPKHREAFERTTLPFRSVRVRSDAETACLGAHKGRDGAILILGTGSQGVLHKEGMFTTVGGWGFALSDSGSGAILGRASLRRALLAQQGIEPASPFTDSVMERFKNDPSAMLEWSNSAKPGDWATFAKSAFEYSYKGDAVASELVRQNADTVSRMLDRLIDMGARRICLMGGVADPTRPYLPARFNSVLTEPEGDALDGALLLCAKEGR